MSAQDSSSISPIRIGTPAPNFTADTTFGELNFHDYIDNSWCIFFSHPNDFTPVCTTELGAMAKLHPEFKRRGVKLLGLSCNSVDSHERWIADIEEIICARVEYPIVADNGKVAELYGMVDANWAPANSTANSDGSKDGDMEGRETIRSLFIIDNKKKVRLIMGYPASCGRNTAEVLRVLDGLMLSDRWNVSMPVNWVPGDDVIVGPSREGMRGVRIIKPYFRLCPVGALQMHEIEQQQQQQQKDKEN